MLKSTVLRVLVALSLALPLCATATIHVFYAALTGPAEVPGPGNPAAVGSASMMYNDATDTIVSLSVFGTGLSGPVAAGHIHLGPTGVAGPVIVPLPAVTPLGPGAFSLSVSGVGFPAVHEAALIADGTYLNFHTASFPGGELRGQLIRVVPVPVPEAGTWTMLAAGLAFCAFAIRRTQRLG